MKWKSLYSAAIAETNRAALGVRIAEAEAAIVARSRELFSETGTDVDIEREALEDALYALRALRSVLACHTAA